MKIKEEIKLHVSLYSINWQHDGQHMDIGNFHLLQSLNAQE